MNKLTQQQVFSLYLANPEQRVKPNTDLHKKTFKLLGMKDPIVFCELDNVKFNYSVSDCKLLVKRISDMSEEHKKEYLSVCTAYYAGSCFDTPNSILWLITHGYCIDESWITNGWVEVE